MIKKPGNCDLSQSSWKRFHLHCAFWPTEEKEIQGLLPLGRGAAVLPNTSIINSKSLWSPHPCPGHSYNFPPKYLFPSWGSWSPHLLSLYLHLTNVVLLSLANTHQQKETQRILLPHVCIPSTIWNVRGSRLWADCGKCVMLSNSTVINCSQLWIQNICFSL